MTSEERGRPAPGEMTKGEHASSAGQPLHDTGACVGHPRPSPVKTRNTSAKQNRGRSTSQASSGPRLLWDPNRMRIAGQVKRLLDEGFNRHEIIEACAEGIFEELAEEVK